MKNSRRKETQKNNNMVSIFEICALGFDYTSEVIVIEVTSYNKNYFQNAEALINAYGLVLKDYINYCNQRKVQSRVKDFLKDSVENNYMLCDSITELDFKIFEDHILFDHQGDKQDYINMGEFYFDNYKVNVCSSYMFFEDLISEEKFLYYGD